MLMHKINFLKDAKAVFYKIPIGLLPRVTEIYKLERKTVWRCADRRNILVFITDGKCLFEIGGEKILLSKGETLLIPSGQEYVRRPYEDTSCQFFYVHFTAGSGINLVSRRQAEEEMRRSILDNMESGKEKLPEYLYLSRKTDVSDKFEMIDGMFEKILNKTKEKNFASLFVSLTFCELLAELAKADNPIFEYGVSEKEERIPSSLQKALSYVRYNYDKKISTSDLCKYCNLSPQHLIRLFKKHTGMTPVQYVNKSKIMHAIELLRASEMSVKEIANNLGYDNPNYFSRLFTKEESVSPTEVRERIYSYDGKESALKTK